MKKRKLLGLWSGHDASFCVLNDGVVDLHVESERHTRIKEAAYDSIKLFNEHDGDTSGLIGFATCHLDKGIKAHEESWKQLQSLNLPLFIIGHHEAHAANAFYSSNFDDALVITIDGGGIENDQGFCAGASIWYGNGTKINLCKYFPLEQVNIGGIWSRVTRHVFKYESGAPFGNQAGTTMALAALSEDISPYVPIFERMFGPDLAKATARAPGHVAGMSAKDPRNQDHPYLSRLGDIAAFNEQAKFDMAGALQFVTEKHIEKLLQEALFFAPAVKNICFSGGVALNSVAMGKLVTKFPNLNFYVPPVPYDAGLTIGATQYVWHHMMENPRKKWDDNVSAYLGKKYSSVEVREALSQFSVKIDVSKTTDDEVVNHLIDGKIVSIFRDRPESGRRALGNRSILADPRSGLMKDRVNEKVKKRQSFRPFAPSVLREHVSEWFETDQESPYMGFVIQFKSDKCDLVPAVVHFDGSARLQTVTKKSNEWYHGFITKFYEKTGVPIILNTSFNDREPIVDSPEHALNCFCSTDIDYLYFVDESLLVKKIK